MKLFLKKNKTIILVFISVIATWVILTFMGILPNILSNDTIEPKPKPEPELEPENEPVASKPVIYLYTEKEQDVLVQLDFKGDLFAHYPDYDTEINGWKVTSHPDGHLINHADNQEYSYIFWEGKPSKEIDWDLSKGFIIKGEDTKDFLQKQLSKMGLTPREYNEFIVYWFPLMQNNAYNLIHFAETQYTAIAPLKITPQPDALLRVFMIVKPLNAPIKIEEQKFNEFHRTGFTVVEWGGTMLSSNIML